MKQRTWKALLAIALVLVLTLSLVPLGAAAGQIDPSDSKAAGESRRLLTFPMRYGGFICHLRGGFLVSRGFGRKSFCSARPG